MVHQERSKEERESTGTGPSCPQRTRPPDYPPKKRMLKLLQVCLRHLTVGSLRRRPGGEQWRPVRSQPSFCTRRNGSLKGSREDFDKQVHSITMREDSLVLGADGWFRDFRQAMERAIAGIAD